MLGLGWEFAGVYNDGLENAASVAKENGVPLYDDMEELFSQGITVAGTSAVNNEKMGIIEVCAAHAVHIMVDKPVAVDREGLERLKKVLEGGRIQVGMMLSVRFMPAVYTLKKLLDSGAIGQLISVEIFNPHKLSPQSRPAWHFDKRQSGGIAVDLFGHSIDTFQWLTGNKITEYSGVMTKSVLEEMPEFFDASQFMVLGSGGVSGYTIKAMQKRTG